MKKAIGILPQTSTVEPIFIKINRRKQEKNGWLKCSSFMIFFESVVAFGTAWEDEEPTKIDDLLINGNTD